ncbi:MAG: asparagine synthase (glutamine-hydrolyzing) [Chitinophagaceae bacterium]
MCGIAGIYSFKNKTEHFNAYLEKCIVTMKHRGPDDKGFWTNQQNYSAAFVRLSIRDISPNGHQPMVSACGNYVLSFNGEIYNSDNYLSVLKNKGVEFKSHSDTEVLLYALIHLGLQKILDEFDGMFAFAFYNNSKNELILARDRAGIKPLYIGYNNDYLIYSSQYDHIINAGFIKNNSINYNAITNYLKYGYMVAGNAVINNTLAVPQGHYIIINEAGFEIKKFYDFSSFHSDSTSKNPECIFKSSVQSQMVSDVPVGTFLSGGVDSPLINLWANELQPVRAFTIGNENAEYDESFYAKEYAKKIGVQHHFRSITETDFLALIDDNFKAFTEPFADFSSIPTLLVAKMAKEFVTVILSGDGPDELFWGYERNIFFPKKVQLFHQPKWKLLLQKLTSEKNISKRYFIAKDLSSFYLQSLQLYGTDYWMKKVYKYPSKQNNFYTRLPESYIDPSENNTAMQMIRWLEMNIHLQRILLKVDRATMYYSLEARVPYLSNAVLDYASALSYTDCIAGNQGKSNIKKILKNYFPKEWVEKKKQGFLVPMEHWINNEIKKDVYNTLLNMPHELAIAFNKTQLKKMLDAQVYKHKDANGFIWGMYALVKWHQLHRNSSLLQ